ncbi:MAG: galactokinase [Clostridium sp.]|nr:galactokinase [Clostridium sp.]
MREKVLTEFTSIFGNDGDIRVFFAPGRVNLIGEHTDYNGGHVFPCALTIGTYLVIRKRQDEKIRLYSMNFEGIGIKEESLGTINPGKYVDWISYPLGIVWALKQKGFSLASGFDALYYGNIPNGSGLSSSASIEVATAFALGKVFHLEISNINIAKLSQFSENEFNMVNCGIMDQFAVAMGKENHAIYLDTATLDYSYAPIQLRNEKIVIMNTNKRRELGDSKYNERRSECLEALERLKTVTSIETLGDLTCEEFEKYKEAIGDPVLTKRAKHAVYENQRTIEAVQALQGGDLHNFGKLMNSSHDSLRDDYEVTGIELDTLVAETVKCEGVIGARMTGAGFGGCAVSIVKSDHVDEVIQKVGEKYKEKIGYAADFYVVSVGNGPKELM